MSKIVKSSLVQEKEQYLKSLETKKKKVLTNLKKNTTSLESMRTGIIDLQQNVAGRMMRGLTQMRQLKEELKNAVKVFKKSKKVPKQEKRELHEILKYFGGEFQDMIEEMLPPPMKEINEEDYIKNHINTDNFDRQRAQDFFSQFAEEVAETDQKEIRKTYVKLANRFHPDKAKSTPEQDQFHLLMQQINSAYERGDLATLLEIQSKYENATTLLEAGLTEEHAIIDFLDIEIQRIERELALLESQLTRIKGEIKNLKRSELGDLYIQEMRMEREGGGTKAMLEGMEAELQKLILVRDSLLEYAETGKLPTALEALFKEIEETYTQEIDMDAVLLMFREEMEMEIEMDDVFFENPGKKKKKKK